jgi:hypothetical protein
MTPNERQLVSALIPFRGAAPELNQTQFLAAMGVDDGRQLSACELADAISRRDSEDVFYSMVLVSLFGLLPTHLPLLTTLVGADWHMVHEDAVSELAEFHDPSTVDALYSATQWVPDYLDFDDARALAVKALWGLGGIQGEAATDALERLSHSDVEVIRRNAIEQLALRSGQPT